MLLKRTHYCYPDGVTTANKNLKDYPELGIASTSPEPYDSGTPS